MVKSIENPNSDQGVREGECQVTNSTQGLKRSNHKRRSLKPISQSVRGRLFCDSSLLMGKLAPNRVKSTKKPHPRVRRGDVLSLDRPPYRWPQGLRGRESFLKGQKPGAGTRYKKRTCPKPNWRRGGFFTLAN